MKSIFVSSKMGVDDLKHYLYYNQFFKNTSFIPVRIALSLALGVAAAYFSPQKIITFVLVAAIALTALIASPLFGIKNKYKLIYRKNLSGAFTQFQVFEFSEETFGFKSEREAEFDYVKYESLMSAAETKTLYVINYSKKQSVIAVKEFIGEDKQAEISRLLQQKLGSRYKLINRF